MEKQSVKAILAELKMDGVSSCLITDTNRSSAYLDFNESEWDIDFYDGVLVVKNQDSTHFIDIEHIVSITC